MVLAKLTNQYGGQAVKLLKEIQRNPKVGMRIIEEFESTRGVEAPKEQSEGSAFMRSD